MSSRRRGLAALLPLVLVAGCIRGSTLPPLERYRLTEPTDSTSTAPAAAYVPALDGRISVARFDTPGIYGDENIVYRVGATDYGAYPNREWALPLSEMLGMMAERVLRQESLGSDAVFEPRGREQFAYEWRGAVRQFEEVDENRSIRVAVSLEARLLRSGNDSLLWRGERRVEEEVSDHSMGGIVEAMSRAAHRALTELAQDAKTAVGRVAADSTAPKP